jgi:HAMP domain-containing protein
MARRSLKEFSFGYSIPKGGEKRAKDGANDLTEIDLAEVGPTLKGMNPATELHAVKSALDVEEPAPLDPGELREAAKRVAREHEEARIPDVPVVEPEPEPDPRDEEVQALKAELAELRQEVADMKKAEVADKEPRARSVDPLRKQAETVALEFASDGLSLRKPPRTPAPAKQEPELSVGDLKKRMREEMLVHLSGGNIHE